MKQFDPQWIDCDVLCIVGPTASGKTKFAVWCAEQISRIKGSEAEIISADSRQVYRDMNLGTGKDLDDYGSINYHLINIVEAGEKYNLFRYKQDFHKAYNDIISKGHFPIMCGGSGLYVESICKDYSLKAVEPDLDLRRTLEQKPMQELIDILTLLKKNKGIKPHNVTDFDTKKRVIRAIEIELNEENHNITTDSTKTAKTEKLKFKVLGLNPLREKRNRLIDQRLEKRLQEGMIEEVKGLLERGIPAEDLIYYGLEYKFITKYLIGDFDYDYMKELLAVAIHQFAKRQMTWLRGMERRGTPIEWVNPDDYYTE